MSGKGFSGFKIQKVLFNDHPWQMTINCNPTFETRYIVKHNKPYTLNQCLQSVVQIALVKAFIEIINAIWTTLCEHLTHLLTHYGFIKMLSADKVLLKV